MSSHGHRVQHALRGLVSNRIYPNAFPQPLDGSPPVWPAIRYVVISRTADEDLCGDGTDEEADWHMQIDVVALTYAQVDALRLQVMAAMDALDAPARLIQSSDDYDTETKTHRVSLEYMITSSSDQPPHVDV